MKIVALLLSIIQFCQAQPITEWYNTTFRGRNTYYGKYSGNGACQLDQGNGTWVPREISGINFTTSINGIQYDSGACGMCIRVTGRGVGVRPGIFNGTYTVYVNNHSPELPVGILDFGNKSSTGGTDITWRAVPCNVGSNKMKYRIIGHQWWFKISPQAVRYPVKAVSIFYNGAWFKGVKDREQYYVFQSDLKTPFKWPMRVQVTSIFNQRLSDNITHLSDFVPGRIQFPLMVAPKETTDVLNKNVVSPKETIKRTVALTTESALRGKSDADKACTCDNGLKAPCGAACCDDGESYCDPGYGCCGPNCYPDGAQCCSDNYYCDPGYDCCAIATQGIVCVATGTCGTPTVQDETVHQAAEIIGKICGPFGCV
jgi:expansin (peptidoglycan-binding protein)